MSRFHIPDIFKLHYNIKGLTSCAFNEEMLYSICAKNKKLHFCWRFLPTGGVWKTSSVEKKTFQFNMRIDRVVVRNNILVLYDIERSTERVYELSISNHEFDIKFVSKNSYDNGSFLTDTIYCSYKQNGHVVLRNIQTNEILWTFSEVKNWTSIKTCAYTSAHIIACTCQRELLQNEDGLYIFNIEMDDMSLKSFVCVCVCTLPYIDT